LVSKLGIVFVIVGIVIWLFGPFFQQFKDFTTIVLIVAGFIIVGIFLIIKSKLKKNENSKNRKSKRK